MNKTRFSPLLLGGMLAATMYAAPAQAQATRTWVSGTGDDANPCSRTQPCKTFAGAYGKTGVGGEISVLDPGGYGQVTISHALTINGEGTLAGILSGSGSGITVSAGSTDQVILRNLSINGASGGTEGITINSGNVTIDKCFIYDFTSGLLGGFGIYVNASTSINVDIRDTDLTNNSWGVAAGTTSGQVTVSLDNVRITGAGGAGVSTLGGTVLTSVRNSYIKNSGTAVMTGSAASTINIDHSELTDNSTAANASVSGSTIRMNDVSMYDNTTGLAIASGATIATASNNKSAGNGTSAAPNGTINNF